MVVIAGLMRRRHPVVALQGPCPSCHRESIRIGIVEKRAFDLFWIPVVPLGSAKMLLCLICGGTTKVKGFEPLPGVEVPADQVRARLAALQTGPAVALWSPQAATPPPSGEPRGP